MALKYSFAREKVQLGASGLPSASRKRKTDNCTGRPNQKTRFSGQHRRKLNGHVCEKKNLSPSALIDVDAHTLGRKANFNNLHGAHSVASFFSVGNREDGKNNH